MTRKSIYALIWTLISLFGVPKGAFTTDQPVRHLSMSPVSFAQNFQALRQRKEYAWWDMHPMAFAPSSTQVAVGGFAQREDGIRVGQVWTTSFSDAPATMVTEEVGAIVQEIHWSPDGSKLAYVTRTQSQGVSDFDLAIKVVDLRTGHKTVVSSSGATSPLWSLDGRSLCFWQVSDDPRDRTGLRPTHTTWRPYRIDLASMRPHELSHLTFDAPGVVSPDGSRLGGMVEATPVIEVLNTHHVEKYGIPGTLITAEAMSWSSDSQWFYLHLSDSAASAMYHEAIQAATGKRVDLTKAIAAAHPAIQETYNAIGMVNWFPEKPHLLLLEARKVVEHERRPGHGIQTRRWLLYDLDAASTQRLDGLDLDGGDVVISPSLKWSADHHYALSHEKVFRMDPTPDMYYDITIEVKQPR